MTHEETPHEREARVVLWDLKARKGHLCTGGRFLADVPVCGCGVNLLDEPDFMGPPPDEPPAENPTWKVTYDRSTAEVVSIEPHDPAPEPPAPATLQYRSTEPYRVVEDRPPFRHANGEPCHGCQSCLAEAEVDDDPPPWDTSGPPREKLDHNAALLDHDQLEQKGKEITDAHGSGEVDMRPGLPPIDPTRPYGPAEIEARILEANNRLERGMIHEANLVAAAEHLGVEYKLAFARALRDSTGGAADVRKADATIATEALFRQWSDAVAAMKAMQSVTHSLRSTLSGYQSVGKSVGVSYNVTSGRGR